MEFDEAVDGLGAAVAGTVGREVGQERRGASTQGPPEAGAFGDRTRRQGGGELLGDLLAVGRVRVPAGQAKSLGDGPGDEDRVVLGADVDGPLEAGPVPFGELLGPGAQQGLDAEQRVALAALVPERVLLDPASD